MIYFWVKYRHYSNPDAFRLIHGSIPDFEYFKTQAYSWDLIGDFFTSKSDATDYASENNMLYLEGSNHFDAYKQ